MARTKTAPEAVDRIRITIMDPPSRSPLIEGGAKAAKEETVVDLRDVAFDAQIGPLLGAVDGQGGERLRVRVRSIAPATLAALQLMGRRYQVIANGADESEILVWRHYTPEQRRRYFRQSVDGR